jgi:hypothetical protein
MGVDDQRHAPSDLPREINQVKEKGKGYPVTGHEGPEG